MVEVTIVGNEIFIKLLIIVFLVEDDKINSIVMYIENYNCNEDCY